ncbi:hypothetical protein P5704_026970 (plasmid) [Pseudomonas sp. FeN3W]|nr:hypothetical protein P5704_026970 [Pseudomonas sp. FeN3W]
MTLLRRRMGQSVRTNEDAIPFAVKIASILFASKRSDYYLYLADMMEGTRGSMSLKQILAGDAQRYAGTTRGTLAKHWHERYQEGGSLKRTFAGTLPREDIAIMDMLQSLGFEGALEEGLRDMARNRLLISKAKGTIITTLMASVVCMVMLLALVFAMPSYTTPKLAQAFSILPPDQYPISAKKLFAFSEFVTAYWSLISLGVIGLVVGIGLSLGRVTGPVRQLLDKYGIIWGMYRDFQSISFLSNLASLARKRGNTSHKLRDAILLQREGGSLWKRHHVDKMIEMIDTGESGAPLFCTGILVKEMEWYIADLIESRGLEDALQFVRLRLEDRVMKKITLQSTLFSWVLMISAIVVAGYLMFWHIAVIDDMRYALQNFLS